MASAMTLAKPLGVLGRNFFVIPFLQPSRQFKSALKIKWVRPEKIPCILPEQSGDLAPLGEIDPKQIPTPYKDSTELQSADELVQRLYTFEFLPRSKLKEEFIIQYTDRVKAHKYDDDSPEVKIAKQTVIIRNLQIHIAKFPQDIKNKCRLKESIDKRNRRLRFLRDQDYKKYEWLLEKLDIIYKTFRFDMNERVERKKSLRRLTMLFIEKLKAERLADYKAFLESQQEMFLDEKLNKYIWMKKTEEELGVEPSVTDADIEAVRKQLEDWKVAKGKTVTQ